MVNNRTFEDYVILLLESLKKKGRLPYRINLHRCPDKNKDCKQHHGEVIIVSYNKEDDTFFLRYYGSHIEKIIFESHQPIKNIVKLFDSSHRSRRVRVYDLRKDIDFTDEFRSKVVSVRLTNKEFDSLNKKAQKTNKNLGLYIREEILALN